MLAFRFANVLLPNEDWLVNNIGVLPLDSETADSESTNVELFVKITVFDFEKYSFLILVAVSNLLDEVIFFTSALLTAFTSAGFFKSSFESSKSSFKSSLLVSSLSSFSVFSVLTFSVCCASLDLMESSVFTFS